MGEVVSKEFYDDIKKVINESRKNVRNYVNTTILIAYWNIGKKIVEFQGGKDKSKYGDRILIDWGKEAVGYVDLDFVKDANVPGKFKKAIGMK